MICAEHMFRCYVRLNPGVRHPQTQAPRREKKMKEEVECPIFRCETKLVHKYPCRSTTHSMGKNQRGSLGFNSEVTRGWEKNKSPKRFLSFRVPTAI